MEIGLLIKYDYEINNFQDNKYKNSYIVINSKDVYKLNNILAKVNDLINKEKITDRELIIDMNNYLTQKGEYKI